MAGGRKKRSKKQKKPARAASVKRTAKRESGEGKVWLSRTASKGTRKTAEEASKNRYVVASGTSLRLPFAREERRLALRPAFSRLLPLLRQALTVEGLVALLLAVLLFYPPYFRGLFFARELLPTHVFTAVIFSIFAFYKLTKGELVFFQRPLDYAVFALLDLYFISCFVAWNDRDAVAAVLKMANYVAVYWLLAYSVRSLRAVENYLKVFFASGTGVALLGLGAAFGTFHYKDAFVGGRIYSSLQYPNTLASYLTAINLFGLYLWARAGSILTKVAFAVGNYLLFLVFLGTQSRGGYLVYPLGLLLFLVSLPGGLRWRAFGQFFLQVVAVFAVAGRVASCFGGQSELAGWLWVLAGAALISLIQVGWWRLEESLRPRLQTVSWRSEAGAGEPDVGHEGGGEPGTVGGEKLVRRRLRPWVLPTAAALAVLLLAWGGYSIWKNSEGSVIARLLPEAWLERVESISLQERNVQERLIWSRDAFRIIISSPVNALLGTGGGGWNALYHKFQDYLYFSTEVHNHFLQVGVETGFPGLLTFCAIWVFFFLSTWRVWRQRPAAIPAGRGDARGSDPGTTQGPGEVEVVPEAARGASWAIFSSAVALGIHSAIDFNLSLGAVAMLLWGLFGLGRGLERLYAPQNAPQGAVPQKSKHKRSQRSVAKWLELPPAVQGIIVGIAVGLFFFVSLSLMVGQKHAAEAAKAAKKQDSQAVVSSLERAVSHDPWNSSYRADLARIYLYHGEKSQDAQALKRAQQLLQEAVSHSRGDFQLRLLYARVLFSTGRFEEGLRELETAVELMPLKQEVYESLTSGYFSAGRFLLEKARELSGNGEKEERVATLREKARGYLEKAVAVPQQVEERMAAVPEEHKKLWTRAPLLEVSHQTYLQSGKAAALLGRWEVASSYLEKAARAPGSKAEALLWQGLVLEKQGRSREAEQLLAEAVKLQPDLEKERSRIEPLLPDAEGSAGGKDNR
ncbi:MAG: O-antigen ligase-like protein [Thermoanaerobacterales bacterium 50_218]|nr:MAG: O-antigen ligase-like protein [Thermoanaerobacterales bacterium 50_218]